MRTFKEIALLTLILMLSLPLPPCPAHGSGDLLLKAELVPRTVYMGEQAIFILQLQRKVDVENLTLVLPEIEHISFRPLGRPREMPLNRDGKEWKVTELRYALIASSAGRYQVGPVRVKMDVFASGPGPSLFSEGREPMSLVSDPLHLQILPLPEQGKPEGTIPVGQYRIESRLEPAVIRKGESAIFTVIVSGLGDIGLFPDIHLSELPETRIYPEGSVLNEVEEVSGLKGSKRSSWVLVPLREGTLEVPPIRISYFNPEDRKYQTLETTTQSLSVLPVQEPPGRFSGEGASEKRSREPGGELLPIHGSWRDASKILSFQPHEISFWILALLPPFCYVLAAWGVRYRRRRAETYLERMARGAGKAFLRKWGKGTPSSKEAILVIRDFFNSRFGLSLCTITPNEAAQILREKGVSNEIAGEMEETLKRLEADVYTGRGNRPLSGGEVVPALIRKIDEACLPEAAPKTIEVRIL